MCIRLYTTQTNIPMILSSCHAPPLLDRVADSKTTLTDTYTNCAADIPNQNIWKGNLNTSRFCGLEVLPTDGDTFRSLYWQRSVIRQYLGGGEGDTRFVFMWL